MKTLVWSQYTRLFHALVALGFLLAYVSGEAEEGWVFTLHIFAGSLLLGLMLLRIPWGWLGVRYSRFKDFDLRFSALKDYFIHFFSHKPSLGHNPASSFSALGLILLGILVPLSGFLIWGVKDGDGLFAFMYDYPQFEELLEELHELGANLFLLLVLAHIGGALFEHLFHKSEIIRSMIDGNKPMQGESVRLNIGHHLYGFFWILTAIVFAIYATFFS